MANSAPLVGQQIGNYRIMAPVAAGAFGIVYQAKHQYLQDRVVAIKVLHMHLSTAEEQQRFVREAQLLEKLQHRHILSILDVGIFNNLPYLITPYAGGGSLRQRVKRAGQIPPWDVTLRLVTQIGQALYYAHQQQVVHRDLKPENILLSEKNEALLADFGIASVLASQSMKYTEVTGTPAYMAPEQFRGMAGPQSDQYSLACIVYELVTGQPPFQAPDFIAMGFKHASEPVPPPSRFIPTLPKAIEQAILKALSKERNDRYADVLAFLSVLQTTPSSNLYSSSSPTTITEISQPQQQDDQVEPELHTVEQWLDEADRLWSLGRKEESLAACEEAVRLDPDNEEALLEKGITLLALGRYEDALISYELVLHINPDNVRALSNKGYALYRLSCYQDALISYDLVLHLDPDNIAALKEKGDVLHALYRYQESLTCYNQVLHLDPENVPALAEKGDVLYQLGRYQESLIACEQALRLDASNVFAMRGKGRALYGLEQYQGALASYEQALRLHPQHTVSWFYKGETLYAMRRYREALTVYDQCLRLDPDFAGAYREKGYTLFQLQRYREAIPAFDQSLRLYPQNARTHAGKGWALAKLGYYQEALACYDHALQLFPGHELAQDLRQEALQHLPRSRW
jgi:serine/threonine protein kinase